MTNLIDAITDELERAEFIRFYATLAKNVAIIAILIWIASSLSRIAGEIDPPKQSMLALP